MMKKKLTLYNKYSSVEFISMSGYIFKAWTVIADQNSANNCQAKKYDENLML